MFCGTKRVLFGTKRVLLDIFDIFTMDMSYTSSNLRLIKEAFASSKHAWHVGFVSSEKHCSEVFFRWVALRFPEIT